MFDYQESANLILQTKGFKNVIIEALGIPASGKSYFARSIYRNNASDLNFHTIDIAIHNRFLRVLYKLAIITFELFYKHKLIKNVMNLTSNFKFCRGKIRIRLIFNFLYIVAICKRNVRKQKPLVLDQGIFQGLWSCYFYNVADEPDNNRIKKNLIDLFINLKIDKVLVLSVYSKLDKIVLRLKNREIKGNTGLDAASKDSLQKALQAFNHVKECLCIITEDFSKVSIHEIQN